MGDRVYDGLRPLGQLATVTERPRNPLRSEADAFRLLIMVLAAAALVVAVAVLISGALGAALALVLLAIGGWRAWGLFQTWRREGSDPYADQRS